MIHPPSNDSSEPLKPEPIPERKVRKALRIFGVGFSVAMLLLAALIVITVLALPSISDLRKTYFASRLTKPVTTVQPITMELRSGDVRKANVSTTSASTRSVKDATVSPTPTPAPQQQQTTLADYAVSRFVERGDQTLRVCETLTSQSNVPNPTNTATFTQVVQNQITTEQPNAFAEAALAPLGALLQLPSVGNVALDIRDAQDSGDLSIIQQVGFYSDVAFAAADVYRNKAALDLVSQHAYHLSVMAKLASLAPSATNQPEFLDLCSQIEGSTMNPLSTTLESLDQEKSDILNLMGALGLSPQQVGYDPALDTRLSIDITPQAVTVLSPWMDSMYRSGLQLSAVGGK